MVQKILYVCPSSGIGGVETFLKSTAMGHSSLFEPHYLLFRDGPLRKKLDEGNSFVDVFPTTPRLSKFFDRRKVKKYITNYATEHGIHLIHGTMAYGALFSAKAASKLKIPFVWFQHGPASGWMDRLAGIRSHQGILYNSKFTQKKQNSLESPLSILVPKNRMERILPLGTLPVSADFPDPNVLKKNFLLSHDLPQGTITFAMLCRIQSWKGVHQFLAALRILKSKSEKFHGFVWGESFGDDDYLNRLKVKAKSENIPVTFMGPTQDPLIALSCSDVLVNASIQPEPFGLTIIEAMSCSRTVIAPNEGGPKEIIEDQISGLLFEPRNPESLAKKMETFLEPKTLEKFSLASHKRWSSHYRNELMIKNLEQFYREILGPQSQGAEIV